MDIGEPVITVGNHTSIGPIRIEIGQTSPSAPICMPTSTPAEKRSWLSAIIRKPKVRRAPKIEGSTHPIFKLPAPTISDLPKPVTLSDDLLISLITESRTTNMILTEIYQHLIRPPWWRRIMERIKQCFTPSER